MLQAVPIMFDMLDRDVEIQISNDTKNITLKNPRTHFHHGHSCVPLRPSVPPQREVSSHFTNSIIAGCEGILTYEAETFTVAIYFCNPMYYFLNPVALGLEISLEKCHLQLKPKDIFLQMGKGRRPPYQVSAADHVVLSDDQNGASVSAGHVRVVATMSSGRRAVIRVVVEDVEGLGEKYGKSEILQNPWGDFSDIVGKAGIPRRHTIGTSKKP